MKLLITREIPQAGINILKQYRDIELDYRQGPPLSEKELLAAVKDIDAIIPVIPDKINKKVINAAKNLKVIAAYSVGYDHIDVEHATSKNIFVGNTPGDLTEAIAEHAFALMMAAGRRIPEADRFCRSGNYKYWNAMNFIGPKMMGDTLGIIGFGLGIWIGGIFTYKNLNSIAQKGYALTLAPVGTNKNIFLKTFKDLAHHFDQVLLMGSPPFIKDVLDEGRDRGIAWGSHRIKILTATEGFSERFRLYLAKKAGIQNPLRDIINVYGTVELGTMAHETPVANLIRRLAVRHKGVYRSIFPDATLLPTLAQYYPHLTYFEEVGGELVATGFGSSYPLVRYRLHDRGGVIGFDEMIEKFKELNIDILAQAMRAGIGETIMRLPFVYVYERSDFVVVLRGANIYPEHIRAALQLRELEADVTGKCAIAKKEDKKLSERLEVHVELRKGVPQIAARIRRVSKAILAELCARNSEFAYLYTTEGTSIAPRILLHSYEDPVYFPPGIKQKWVIR